MNKNEIEILTKASSSMASDLSKKNKIETM